MPYAKWMTKEQRSAADAIKYANRTDIEIAEDARMMKEYSETHKEELRQRDHADYLARRDEILANAKVKRVNRTAVELAEDARTRHEYNQTHKAQSRRRVTEWHQRQKLIVIDHYTEGKRTCTRRGFSDLRALSVEHIKGGGNKHRKAIQGKIDLYRWVITNNFPKDLTILCMNCQFIRKHSKIVNAKALV
jgi:hypothetical protein